jgi:hypothetical protein
MDRLSESDLYSAGLSDNFIKSASVNIDRLLEATGLPQATGEFGRQVGAAVGRPEYGEELGRGLPRAAVNFLPMFVPGVGPVAAAAGTGLLSGAEAYTNTGSPAAGILAGAANVVMPGAARFAEQKALQALGVAPIAGRVPVESLTDVIAGGATRAVSERIPTTIPQGLISQAAGQGAAGVLGVGSELAQQALAGQPLRVDPIEQLLNLTLGQVPFAGLYATKGGLSQLGGETSRARAAELQHTTKVTEDILKLRQMQDDIKKKTPLEQIPPAVEGEALSPAKLAELNSRLSGLYNRQQALKEEGSPLTEDEWNETSRQINEELRQQQGAERATTLMGVKVDGKTERMVLKGEEVRTNASGTGRLIRVADLDENGPYAGKEVWYSTLHEPKVGPGEYSVPIGFTTESKWTKGPTPPPKVEGQPELPIQAEPGAIEFDFQHVLNEAEQDLGAAKTISDYHRAAQKLNAVREANDFAPYSDLQLAARMQKLKLKSEKDALQSAISETKRVMQERQEWKAAEAANRVEDMAYAADLEQRRQISPERPEGDPVAQQIHELRSRFVSLGGRYGEVVSQGLFDKAAREWEASGAKNIEDLKARFPSAIAQGKGLKLMRAGEPSKEGAYFATEDSGYGEGVSAKPYELKSEAKVADTRKVAVSDELLNEVLKDPNLTEADREELTSYLGEGELDYTILDRFPLAAAAKKLGYDAVQVRENDDMPGQATSVFVLEPSKSTKPTPEVKADIAEVTGIKAATKAHPREALPLVETVKTRAMDLAYKITEPMDQNEYMHAVEEGDFQRAVEIAADYGLHLDLTRPAPVEEAAPEIRGSQQGTNHELNWDAVIPGWDGVMHRAEGPENQDPTSGIFHFAHPDSATEFLRPGRNIVTKQLHPDARGFISRASKITLLDEFGLMTPEEYLHEIDKGEPLDAHNAADRLIASYLRNRGFDFYAFDDAGMGSAPEIVVLNDRAYTGAPRPAPTRRAESPAYVLELQEQIGRTGHSVWSFLTRPDAHPELQALMQDLAKFSGSLERIQVSYPDIYGANAQPIGVRKTRLNLGAHIFTADPVTRDWTLAHELVHGLTMHELDMPSNQIIRAQFSGLRMEAISRLLPDRRALYNSLDKSGWYTRYAMGRKDARLAHLGDSEAERQIMYGLLSDDEFMAQGFSSKPFQDFLKSHKTSTGETYYHRFVNWVKELLKLGHIDSTLFEQFMSYSDQVLAQNNYISRVQNYGERFLELHGVEPYVAQNQTLRALGLLQQNNNPVVTADTLLLSMMDQVSVSSALTKSIKDYLLMPDEDIAAMGAVWKELGYDEMRGEELNTLFYEAVSGMDIEPLLDIMPETVSNNLFVRARDMHQVADTLRAMTRDKIAGRLSIATPDKIAKPAAELTKQLERIIALEEAHGRKIREVQKVANVAPAAYLDSMRTGVPEVVRHALIEDEAVASTVMERFLEKPAQFARRHPQVGEFVSKGYQLLANSRKMAAEGFRAFGIDLATGTNTTESVEKFVKSLGNQKVVKAVDRWMYWNNKKGGDKVTTLSVSDPDVANELRGLSTAERQTVIDTIAKKEASQVFMNAQVLEKMAQVGAVNASTLIGPRTGLKANQNLAITEALMEVLIKPPEVLAMDPEAQAKIAMVQSKLQPEVFLDLLKFTQTEAEKWRTYKEYFDANPGWSSAQRFGKFDLLYRRGGKEYRDAVDSKREAEEVAKGGQIIRLERRSRDSDDGSPHIGSDFQGILEKLRALEENQTEILRTIGMSPDDIADIQKYSPVEEFAFQTQYGRGVPVPDVRARRLTKGAEELPWLSNHFSWIHKSSTFWSRQLFRAQARMLRGDPELVERPDLRQWTQQHAANILNPDPEGARVASKFTTTWLMGFNVASTVANGTQLLNRGVAELTSLTGKPLESYKRMGAATREIIDWGKTGRWGSDEHKRLIDRLYHDGEVNLSMYDDEVGMNEAVMTNFKRATVRGKPHTLGQWLTDAAGTYSTASMWMFRNVERFNNIGASLMAFDHYRSLPDSTFESAYMKATEFNHAVNDVGGRVNRSVGLFSGKDDFSRSGAMLANSMQSYVLGSTWQMVNYLKSGWFRPAGLKPHEVYAARKAAIQMLSTQFAMAGALGMPFVSGALALLDKSFPELELNRRLREFVGQLFADDAGNANVLADIAMTGMPSMMGWDWQSRLSMGNTVPGVSEINGFQPELLLGAPMNVISNFVKGGYKTVTGQAGFGPVARDMMPPFLKKILDTVQVATTGGTQLKDAKDRPIYDPTLGESIGLAFGFQPKGLSDQNAAARIIRQAEDVSKNEIGQFHSGVADEVLRGNFGTARQTLLDRAQRDELYDPTEGARAVARAAEEQTFVRDLRREGTSRTAQTRSKLLSAFNLEKSAPSETARFQFRQQVEQRLGLPPSAQSSHELVVSQMVDQLRAARPDATRVELRRAAEAALRGPKRRSLSPASL